MRNSQETPKRAFVKLIENETDQIDETDQIEQTDEIHEIDETGGI